MAQKKSSGTLTPSDRKVLKAFGTKVRELRERQKRSVYDLTGDDMHIKDRQHWQRIENGQKNIQLTTIVKLAETLEVEPAELMKF